MVSVIKRDTWSMGEGLLMSSWGPGKGLRTLTPFLEKYNPTITPLPDLSNMISCVFFLDGEEIVGLKRGSCLY